MLREELAVLLRPNEVTNAELVAALRNAGHRVILNAQRSAIQISACGEPSFVIAHIPLDRSRLAILLEAVADDTRAEP